MIIPGLCSISFRNLSVEEIISLAQDIGIPAIEWGGDVHVPHGNIRLAQKVGSLSRERAIRTPSYGSYYRVGVSEKEGISFDSVLKSALALGEVETIRVWGGCKCYVNNSPAELQAIVDDSRRIADLAGKHGISISFEYHDNTVTNSPDAVRAFDKKVAHPNIYYYWQPPHQLNHRAKIQSLRELEPRVTNLHLFYWTLGNTAESLIRHPLAKGAGLWRDYLREVECNGKNRFAFLEFVKSDKIEQLRADWRVLQTLITEL